MISRSNTTVGTGLRLNLSSLIQGRRSERTWRVTGGWSVQGRGPGEGLGFMQRPPGILSGRSTAL